jgi:hypothetical protein
MVRLRYTIVNTLQKGDNKYNNNNNNNNNTARSRGSLNENAALASCLKIKNSTT